MPTARVYQKRYKKLLTEAKKLQIESGKLAFKRIKLLVEAWKDEEFRADIGLDDDFDVGEYLDDWIEDLNLNFNEARIVFERFPKEKEWADGKLKTKYQQIVIEQRAKVETDKPAQTRKNVTRAEYDKLKRDKDDSDYRLKILERSLDMAERTNSALIAQIDQLTSRIKELESQLSAV